jgi:pyridoxal/pyridoxine/pyridoxamine kinase
MNNVDTKVSDNYQDYLIDYLRKNTQLAAAYLTETLAEEKPEPQFLQQAINQVYIALLRDEHLKLNDLLTSSEAETVYKFVSLLKSMGLKINLEVTNIFDHEAEKL